MGVEQLPQLRRAGRRKGQDQSVAPSGDENSAGSIAECYSSRPLRAPLFKRRKGQATRPSARVMLDHFHLPSGSKGEQ